MKKQLYQVITNLDYGDAASNFALLLNKSLRELNYQTDIFYQNKSSQFLSKFSHISSVKKINTADNTILFHYSIGSEITEIIKSLKCKIIIYYHGITPPEYLIKFSDKFYILSKKGQDDLLSIKDRVDVALTSSPFLKEELTQLGFKDVRILPLAIPFSDYNISPSEKIFKSFCDKKVNLLTVARIFPHKKIEDIILIYYYYNKYINKNSRLIIVGEYSSIPSYYEYLINLVKELGLSDVIFTGKVPFDELLSYYKTANIYLHASEHEGFCVPIIEAMFLGIPVIAYDKAAVKGTMGDAGILFNNKDYAFISELIDKIENDNALRNNIINKQKKHAESFSEEVLLKNFTSILNLI